MAGLVNRIELTDRLRISPSSGARFRHRRNDLTVAGFGLVGSMPEGLHLALAPDKLGQPGPRRTLKAGPQRLSLLKTRKASKGLAIYLALP
jgi:hypothetical protein